MQFPIRKKLFYSHFLAVLLVSGSIGTYFYHSATSTLFSHLRNRLMNSAALISRTIDARNLVDIREPSDVNRPSYHKHLQMLREFQAANEDIAFIYAMKRIGDKVVFVIDSDTSEKQALPGRPYEADAPHLRSGFTALTADSSTILEQEIRQIRRSGTESSLILVDMDHFKRINDRFGHAAGDRVLAHAARILKGILRNQDAVSRWGGEELLILLPRTAGDGAARVAENIRAAFAGQPVRIDDQDIRVTASLGVCPMSGAMSIDEYFREADKAMYRAKAEGRNRIVMAG